MLKEGAKRLLALILCVLMVCSLLPTAVFSADTSLEIAVDGLDLSYTSDNATWSSNGDSVTGKVNSAGCSTAGASTLTITNKKAEAAELSFSYTVTMTPSGGKAMIGDTEVSGSGTYTKLLEPNTTITITITSPTDDNSSTSIVLTDIQLIASDPTASTTFLPSEGGSYTVDGTPVTAETVLQKGEYALSAAPADGFEFVGWYRNERLYSQETAVTFKSVNSCTVTAWFVPSSAPVFDVGGKGFLDLNEALRFATESGNTKVTLISSGVLPTGSYTVPAGITLLVPFDADGTLYAETPGYVTSSVTPAVYKTLTMASGAILTVNGAISVGSKHCATNGAAECCKPTGAYGMIKMQQGSAITLTDGAKLYAWGYITGDGSVTAQSGATVYEYYQITDWRGGSATLSMYNSRETNKVFPFSQYYVQNIEVPLTVQYGATEYAYVSITGGGETTSAAIPFIGSNGLFRLTAGGQLTKQYHPATDRISYEIVGDSSLNNIALTVKVRILTVTVDSAEYVLPITNNVDIVVRSGQTTVNKDLALLPGVTVTVDAGAELKVASEASLYVYDKDQWNKTYLRGGKEGGTSPVAYTPSGKGTRTTDDVIIDLNGTLIAEGSVYTTVDGANICSVGGAGRYLQSSTPGANTITYQCTQNVTEITYVEIPVTSAKLRNADGSYTETAGAAGGTAYSYNGGVWRDENTVIIRFDPNGGIGETASLTTEKNTSTPLTPNAFSRVGYEFSGWNTAADGTGTAYADRASVASQTDLTLYAQWTVKRYTITFDTDGGSKIAPITQDYNSAVTAPADPTKDGYTFAGWDTEIPATMPAENVTVKARWTVNQYTLTFETDGGSKIAPITQDYGTDIVAPAAPTKEGYTFAGWDTEIPATMPAADMTVTAQWTVNKYTISLDTDGGSPISSLAVEFGAAIPEISAPTKDGYTFIGWDKELPAVMPAQNLAFTAVWKANTYKVTFDADGGTATPATMDVVYDQPYGTLPTAARTGYTLIGWFTERDAGDMVAVEETYRFAENTTLYAHWTANTYSVKFVSNDGLSLTETQTGFVYDVDQALRTNTFTRTGYTFLGWSSDRSATAAEYSDSEVVRNLATGGTKTLYAIWQPNRYTVTFHANNGTDDTKTQTLTYDQSEALIENPFTREGYTFLGWNTDPKAVVSGYPDRAVVENLAASGSFDLYAIWKPNDRTGYRVEHYQENADDAGYTLIASEERYGVSDSSVTPAVKEYEGFHAPLAQTVTIQPNGSTVVQYRYTRKTYTVAVDPDGGSGVDPIEVKFGAVIPPIEAPTKLGYTFAGWDTDIPATMPAKNVTLTAQWSINRYTITFDTVGGSEIAPITQDYGTPVTAPSDPTKEGYTFAGWDTELPAIMPAGDMTVKAQWTVNRYTLSFDTVGGSDVSPITQDYGTDIVAPAAPTKLGYTFIGWDTELPATMPAQDLTFTALWEANTYTVTLDADGGTVTPATMDAVYGQPYGTLPTPTKDGYSFVGWYDGDTAITAETVVSVTAPQTLTAKWTVNRYTLTFDTDGGSDVAPITQDYGTDIIAPADPTKAGYTFAGWDTELPATMPAVDMTIKAQWTVNRYTITFDTDGGSEISPITQDYGTPVTAPQAPSRAGYLFDGWSSAIPSVMPAESITVKAKWISYLDLLEALPDFNGENLTRAREYYLKLNAEQTASYDRTALFAAIEAFETAQLEQSIANAVPSTNEKLWLDGEQIAALALDDKTLETDLMLMTCSGMDLLGVPFLEGLFNQKNLTSIKIGDQEMTAPFKQSRIMLAVAYVLQIEINDASTPIAELPMDDRLVTATLNVSTAEGVTFSLDYTVHFFFHEHTVSWLSDGEIYRQTSCGFGDSIQPPADPVREGYTFRGWDMTFPATMPKVDVTVNAVWEVNRYTLTFKDGDETVATLTQDYATAVTAPAAPTKLGYTFTGWDTDIPTAMPAADMTFTAQWQINRYTVSFNTDGGSDVASVTQDYNTPLTAPAAPTKTGYTFAGWDKELPAAMPAADLQLTALWNAKEYTVSFDLGYGSAPSVSAQQVTFNAAFGELPSPTREGYTFVGWFSGDRRIAADTVWTTDADVTLTARWEVGAAYTVTYLETGAGANPTQYHVESATFTLINPTREGYTFTGWSGTGLDGEENMAVTVPTGSTGNREYTAHWRINRYTVSFETDGGTAIPSITQDYGTEISAPADPTKTGYTFAGWDTDIPATMPAGDMTVTAQWTINRYTITFDTDGGSAIAPITQDYGTEIIAPAVPAKTGYTFAGWDTDIPATMPAGDMTVTAQWTVNRYTITFDTDGGSEIAPITQDYGTEIIAPAVPAKTGYTFAGWDTDIPATMPAENVTVTATWTVNRYTITFDTDGGSEIAPIMQDYGTAVTAPADPTKTGYTFAGWDREIPATMPAGDMTIKAQWTVNRYTITFDTDGGSEIAPITQDYGTAVTVPADPTKDGYTFIGWDKEVPAAMPAEDLHIRATWAANTYTVTFDAAHGAVTPATMDVVYGQPYGTLPTPTRDGYSFVGWYDGDTAITAETVVSVTAPQTLTARWNADGDTPYTVEYYRQDLTGDGYTMAESSALTGMTDTTAEATILSYTGFVFNAEQSQTSGNVAADGSLVLRIYYDREIYTVVWDVDGNEISECYRYGATLVAPDTAKADDDFGSYTFIGWDQTVDEAAVKNARYTARYSKSYVASIGDTTYRTLELAMERAGHGDTVRLDADVTLRQDLTVPSGVTLLIPCIDDDCGYIARNDSGGGIIRFNQDGTRTDGKVGVGPYAARYRLLTVPQGVTLTVDGTLMVNAVTGRPAAGHYDQDVTGGYGELLLDGAVVVNGTLENFGYVRGTGIVTANDGATVGDLYIVRNWRGGSQASNVVPFVYPMNEYDLHNIETTLVIHSGATYAGLVKMYAQNQYYYTRFPQADAANGLIRLADGAVLTKTYSDGREHWSIDGGAAFASSTLRITGLELSTGMDYFVYPIDGDIDFVLRNGEYRVLNDYKFLTGATMTVGSDATLEVTQSHILVFYDRFSDVSNTDGTEYPERGAALLTLEKGAVLINNGSFAGIVDGNPDDVRLGSQSKPATTYPGYENEPWFLKTYEANGYCNGVRELEFGYRSADHSHTPVYTAEKPADCTEDGNIACWRCAVCGKHFADAEGTQELSEDVWRISALGHELHYTALGAVITEVCTRGDHTATATLSASATVYSGEEAATAAVTYGDGWSGGDLTVTYENNRSAGIATATAAKGEAVAAVTFEIAKCSDYTLTLGNLTQSVGQVSAVTAMLSPQDPTAEISVEYLVGEGWTTEAPTDIGTYAVRARVTASENLVVTDAYTEATLTVSAHVSPIEIIENSDGSVTVIINEILSDPISLPLNIPSAAAEDATQLHFVIRAAADSANVEIPVTPLTESDVIVRVREDGTDELLPMTPIGKNGLIATVRDGMTLKVVHNAPNYGDCVAWANSAINFVSSRELFNGVGNNTFRPSGVMTRGMLVTVLYRMDGKPEATGAHTFADVPEGLWFSDAVKWAANHGIVKGYSSTVYAPDDPITREQMIAMLYRRSGSPTVAPVETGASAWAADAMSWAVTVGLIQGSEKGYAPKDPATRAEAAVILMRYINSTAK